MSHLLMRLTANCLSKLVTLLSPPAAGPGLPGPLAPPSPSEMLNLGLQESFGYLSYLSLVFLLQLCIKWFIYYFEWLISWIKS